MVLNWEHVLRDHDLSARPAAIRVPPPRAGSSSRRIVRLPSHPLLLYIPSVPFPCCGPHDAKSWCVNYDETRICIHNGDFIRDAHSRFEIFWVFIFSPIKEGGFVELTCVRTSARPLLLPVCATFVCRLSWFYCAVFNHRIPCSVCRQSYLYNRNGNEEQSRSKMIDRQRNGPQYNHRNAQ